MPIDTQTYLRNNGWKGHGTALREGALARPLSIPQKRTLAGVGKDRDEAFPFWDHVFAAASSAIQIKVGSDDETSDSESTPVPTSLRRTTTGILSNKRPPTGTPVDHSPSSTTPSSTTPEPTTHSHPQSVMALAKRAAARKNLYSRFFKGPVLGPDATEKEMVQTEELSMEEKLHAGCEDMRDALEHTHVVHHPTAVDGEEKGSDEGKKRKREDMSGGEVKEDRKKKRTKEEKEQRRAEKAKRKRKAEKEARRAAKASALTTTLASASTSKSTSLEPETAATEDDAKAAKRRAKEDRRRARAEADVSSDPNTDEKAKRRAEKEERKVKKLAKEAERSTIEEEAAKKANKADPTVLDPEGEAPVKRKKKRRREATEETSPATAEKESKQK